MLRRRDGRPLHVLVSASLLRDADGRPDGATTFLQDLSTLRDAEQRRAQQEAFFLALSQRASDLALVTDTDARILYASPGVRNVLGYDPADLVLVRGVGVRCTPRTARAAVVGVPARSSTATALAPSWSGCATPTGPGGGWR